MHHEVLVSVHRGISKHGLQVGKGCVSYLGATIEGASAVWHSSGWCNNKEAHVVLLASGRSSSREIDVAILASGRVWSKLPRSTSDG